MKCRWCGITAGWRDVRWKDAVRAVLHVDADRGRQRLNRGHRYFGRRRWDEVMQRHVDDDGVAEGPWQLPALDREHWGSLSEGFVACVLRHRSADPPGSFNAATGLCHTAARWN